MDDLDLERWIENVCGMRALMCDAVDTGDPESGWLTKVMVDQRSVQQTIDYLALLVTG